LILKNSQTTVATDGHLNTYLPYVPHQKKTPTLPESISYRIIVEIFWNKPEVTSRQKKGFYFRHYFNWSHPDVYLLN